MTQQTKIYFAPFQGITTHTFRNVYSEHFKGVDKIFTPYFADIAVGTKLPPKKRIALKNQFENTTEVIPQILSKNADEIIWFAHQCKQLGFKELNWNLGCPYPQVINKKRGSGLLPYPEMVDEILEKVMSEIEILFSIKCRLGHFSMDEMNALIPVFNNYSISELTIHARTGKQMYLGQTDLDAFAAFAPQFRFPVVYNGDILCLEDYYQFKNRFPQISHLMIGRGILKDPFLPARIKGLTLPIDPKAQISRFIETLYLAYQKEKNDHLTLLNVMKEYWTYLASSFDEPTKIFRKLKKCKTFDEYENAVKTIFEENNWIQSK